MFYVFYSCCGSKIVTAVISVWLKEFTKHLMLAYSYVEIAEIMCVFSSSFFYLIRHFFTKISLCFVSSSGRRLPYSEKSPLLTLKKEGIFSLWRKRIFFFFWAREKGRTKTKKCGFAEGIGRNEAFLTAVIVLLKSTEWARFSDKFIY